MARHFAQHGTRRLSVPKRKRQDAAVGEQCVVRQDQTHPHQATVGWVNYQVLRRSAVSLLNADCGADPTIIAAQCGHTVDRSINVYNKVGLDRQLAAVQKLDNTLQTKDHAA